MERTKARVAPRWGAALLLLTIWLSACSLASARDAGKPIDDDDDEPPPRAAPRRPLPSRPKHGLPPLNGRKVPATGAYEREYRYWYQRALPNGFPRGAELRARREARAHRLRASALTGRAVAPTAALFAAAWTELGPRGMTESSYGLPLCSGRIMAILLQKAQNRILVGTASGGIWKRSLTPGSSFSPRSDFAENLSVGALAADPNDADVLYAGTGEPGISIDAFSGAGLLKSTDGGETWGRVDGGAFDNAKISAVWVDPRNSSRVLVCSLNDGLYESLDAGITFPRKLVAGGGMGFAVSPADPQRMLFSDSHPYGAVGFDLLLTTDGGAHWSPVNGPWKVAGTAIGRIDVAWAPSDATKVWASVAPSLTGTEGVPTGIYRSTNGGATWGMQAVARFQLSNNGEGQAWYDNCIAVRPDNPDQAYVGAVNLFRVSSAGTLTRLTFWTPSGNYPTIHADQHAIAFDPADPNTCYVGNDGGLFATSDNAVSFTHMNDGLGSTQFYFGAVGPNNGFASLIGGTQDNGTLMVGSGLQWDQVIGGDGFQCAVDPQSPNVVYGSIYSSTYFISANGGNSFIQLPRLPLKSGEGTPFTSPITVDPSNGTRIYTGGQRVYRGISNRVSSVTWTALSSGLLFKEDGVYRIAVAPSNGKVIYASGGAHLKRTTAGGGTWSSIDPTGGTFITGVAVHPTKPNYVVVCRSGYGGGQVMRSTNGGAAWTSITADLPHVPANGITLRVAGTQLGAFLATDTGVYFADLNAAEISWTPVGTGLPGVVCQDVLLANGGNTLVAVTHGRGMWSLSAPLQSLQVTSPNGGETLPLGRPTTIRWSASGLPDSDTVALQLSRNSGASFDETLAAAAPNTGQFTWTPTGDPAATCRVRITSAAAGALTDTSDADFALSAAYSLSGRVTLGGSGLAGVTVSASGISTVTGADGGYTLSGLVPGSYTVSAHKAGFLFDPPTRSIELAESATGLDFAGTPALLSLQLKPTAVHKGTQVTGTLRFGAALPGAITVTLATTNATIAPVAGRLVTVPAGAATATFKFKVGKAARQGKVTITGTSAGVTQAAQLTARP